MRLIKQLQVWRDNAKARRFSGQVVNPIPGYPVTYAYGVKSSAYQAGYHTGEDHSTEGETGKAAIAVSRGIVEEVSTSGGTWGSAYGTIVVIATLGRKYRYGYCHLSEAVVAVGDSVVTGQLIGYTGNTGNSTGPHCHFEARVWPFHYGDDVHPIRVKRLKA